MIVLSFCTLEENRVDLSPFIELSCHVCRYNLHFHLFKVFLLLVRLPNIFPKGCLESLDHHGATIAVQKFKKCTQIRSSNQHHLQHVTESSKHLQACFLLKFVLQKQELDTLQPWLGSWSMLPRWNIQLWLTLRKLDEYDLVALVELQLGHNKAI